MSNVLVFGHQNPDTDAICSAIAYAALKRQRGVEVEPVRLGAVNGETAFALRYFGVETPRLVEMVAPEAQEVVLVDHNERQQSAKDIAQVRIVEVIDHHRIANFETSQPLYYRAEPVGCTATILYKAYQEQNEPIPPAIAGLMLSAILSDTLLLKSPTCTEEDVAAAQVLADRVGVDIQQYGLEMLKAGANVRNKSVDELISLDAKEFLMGTRKVVVAQINVVDLADILDRQVDVEAAMRRLIAEQKLDLYALLVTDILQNDSVIIALGEQSSAVERAYGVILLDHRALLKGVVSRKQQVVPVLTEVLSE